MFLSTKAIFENHIPDFDRLLIRAETQLPAEWLKRYKKNVVNLTPKKSSALRRSIITRQEGGRAEVTWRSAYADIQNDPEAHGRIYRKYTTPGTGSHFANKAFAATNSQMPAVLRELGLTQ